MKKLKKSIHQSGFSIMQVMIAAGMMAGVSLLMMRQIQLANVNTRSLEISLNIIELRNRIISILANPEQCSTTMAQIQPLMDSMATSFTDAQVQLPDDFAFLSGTSAAPVEAVSTGEVIQNRVSLASSRIVKISDTDFDLLLTFKKHGDFVGPAQVLRRFSFSVGQITPTVECTGGFGIASSSLNTFCDSLGGTYNTVTGTCDGASGPAPAPPGPAAPAPVAPAPTLPPPAPTLPPPGTPGPSGPYTMPDISCASGSILTGFSGGSGICVAASTLFPAPSGPGPVPVSPPPTTPPSPASGAVADMNCGPSEVLTGFAAGSPVCTPVGDVLSADFVDIVGLGATVGNVNAAAGTGLINCPAGSVATGIDISSGVAGSVRCSNLQAVDENGDPVALTGYSSTYQYLNGVDLFVGNNLYIDMASMSNRTFRSGFVMCPEGFAVSRGWWAETKLGNSISCQRIRFGNMRTQRAKVFTRSEGLCPNEAPVLVGFMLRKGHASKMALGSLVAIDGVRGGVLCAALRAFPDTIEY